MFPRAMHAPSSRQDRAVKGDPGSISVMWSPRSRLSTMQARASVPAVSSMLTVMGENLMPVAAPCNQERKGMVVTLAIRRNGVHTDNADSD